MLLVMRNADIRHHNLDGQVVNEAYGNRVKKLVFPY